MYISLLTLKPIMNTLHLIQSSYGTFRWVNCAMERPSRSYHAWVLFTLSAMVKERDLYLSSLFSHNFFSFPSSPLLHTIFCSNQNRHPGKKRPNYGFEVLKRIKNGFAGPPNNFGAFLSENCASNISKIAAARQKNSSFSVSQCACLRWLLPYNYVSVHWWI